MIKFHHFNDNFNIRITESFSNKDKAELFDKLLDISKYDGIASNSIYVLRNDKLLLLKSSNFCECNFYFPASEKLNGNNVCYSCHLPKLEDRDTKRKYLNLLWRQFIFCLKN